MSFPPFDNNNNNLVDDTASAYDLYIKGLDQVVEENKRYYERKKKKLFVNSARAALSKRLARMSKEIVDPDPKAYMERRMLAFGFDPAEEKSPTKFPEYDYIDPTHSVNSAMFEETYPPGFLPYLANAWEYDVHIQRALEIKAGLITNHGKNITISMKTHSHLEVTQKEVTSKTLQESGVDDMLDKYISRPTRGRLLDYIDNVLAQTQLYNVMTDPVMQRMIFGRGGALIRRIKKDKLKENSEFEKMGFIEGTPVYINPLSTLAMGRILVDPVSWKPSDLWYDAPIFGKDESGQEIPAAWIPAKDLIYLVNKNYHMMPNRLHYGYSDLVTTMPISETLRQIYSEILTEANMNLVLPSLMFTFDDLSEESMQEFVDNYRGGGIMGRNANIGMDKIEFSPNIGDILNEMTALKKILNYGTSIPPIFTEDNDLTNRSIADRIAEVWTTTDLVPLQDEFSESLYNQFYLPVIRHWLENEAGEGESKQFIAAKIKIITNFPKLDFADAKAKAETLQILKNNYVITLQQWQKMMLLDPLPEEIVKALDEVQKRLQENPDWAAEVIAFARQRNAQLDIQAQEQQPPPGQEDQQQSQLEESQNENIERPFNERMEDMANGQF